MNVQHQPTKVNLFIFFLLLCVYSPNLIDAFTVHNPQKYFFGENHRNYYWIIYKGMACISSFITTTMYKLFLVILRQRDFIMKESTIILISFGTVIVGKVDSKFKISGIIKKLIDINKPIISTTTNTARAGLKMVSVTYRNQCCWVNGGSVLLRGNLTFVPMRRVLTHKINTLTLKSTS